MSAYPHLSSRTVVDVVKEVAREMRGRAYAAVAREIRARLVRLNAAAAPATTTTARGAEGAAASPGEVHAT